MNEPNCETHGIYVAVVGVAVRHIAHWIRAVDGSHLHRSFVKQYGCTPGQYRDQGQ
jgi:AraC-like DNA-binding protein